MWKHIIGHAVYQSVVMFMVYFYGTNFLIAELDEGQKQPNSDLIVNGLEINGYDIKSMGPSTHLTYCFNIFVWMQIFNFLNARKLEDEKNIFQGVEINSYFTIIVVWIVVLQTIIVTVGNIAFRCATWGLGIKGWLICIAFGSGSLIIGLLLKFIPEEKFCGTQNESTEAPVQHAENKNGGSLQMRRLGGSNRSDRSVLKN